MTERELALATRAVEALRRSLALPETEVTDSDRVAVVALARDLEELRLWVGIGVPADD